MSPALSKTAKRLPALLTWAGSAPPSNSPGRLRRHSAHADETRQELPVLHQVARSEEMVAHPLPGCRTHPRRPLRVVEQAPDRRAVFGQVSWIADQQARPAVLDLVLDSSDPAGHAGAG